MIPDECLKIPCGLLFVEASHMFGNLPFKIWHEKYHSFPGRRIRLAMNCLFFKSGDEKILIDPGMSKDYMPDDEYKIEYAKPIDEQLMNYGVHPEEIAEVILTHLHFDHCAGIFHYNRNIPYAPAFPSARLLISKEQYKNIINPDPIEKDSFIKDFLFFAEKFYKLDVIEEKEGVLFENIRFLKYSGHSPGMIIPIISLGKDTLAFTTDLIPLSINARLKVVSSYDLNTEKSLTEMKGFLKEAAEKKYKLFLYHEPGENIYINY